MRVKYFFLLVVAPWLLFSDAAAATAPSPLLKAKQEAETRGAVFETSHEEIVVKAKKEANLRVLMSDEARTIENFVKAFKSKYPFINLTARETTRESFQNLILQIKSGVEVNWDLVHTSPDLYKDYQPYVKRFDLLGMAEQKVLAIPTRMIDQVNRSVAAVGSSLEVVAFNRCLLDPAKLPNTWEDFLKPEFKGRKFLVDVRPNLQTVMAAGVGEESMVNYSKRLAAQQPVWVRGQTRALTAMAAGEYALFFGASYAPAMRIIQKNPTGCLQVKMIEPIPVRIDRAHGVLERASYPYAALLWLEFLAGPEAQSVLDQDEVRSSIFSPDSALEKIVRGKKVWIRDLAAMDKTERWMKMAVEAFGFPQAER